MKASELRIGNIIQDTRFPDRECRVFRLTSGNDFSITYQYDKSKEMSYTQTNHDALQPVKITESWLEKFGFRNLRKNLYLKGRFHILIVKTTRLGDSVEYRTFISERWYNHKETIRVMYVHQLQNLWFAITGEELTIKEEGK